MSNLKSAPLYLTNGVVSKLIGDRPAFGKGISHLSLEKAPVSNRANELRDEAGPNREHATHCRAMQIGSYKLLAAIQKARSK